MSDAESSLPTGVVRLAGRERECRGLFAALEEARHGRGRLVLLAGESGIGKTRLCEELEAHARATHVTTCWAHGVDGDAPAFYPWIQIVRAFARLSSSPERPPALATCMELLGGWGAMTGAAVESSARRDPARLHRLVESVAEAIRATSHVGPRVLVFDDLHVADVGTLDVLQLVSVELRDQPLLIVGAYRPEELRATRELAAIVGEIAHRSATLVVGPLEPAASAALIRDVAGEPLSESLVEALARRAGGNPLYARELARGLAASGDSSQARALQLVPHAISDLVTSRLQLRSAGTRQVLRMTAVCGMEATTQLIGAVCQLPSDEVLACCDEAIRAGLAEPHVPSDRLRFREALVRDAVYASIGVVERARLHHAVALAAEPSYVAAAEPRYAELAHHFALAASDSDGDQVVRYERLAGEQAAARHAWSDAARHLTRALDARTPTTDPEEQCEALVALGEVLFASGDGARAGELHAQAVVLARTAGSPRLRATVAMRVTRRGSPLRDHPRFLQLGGEVLAALGEDEPVLRCRLLARRSARRGVGSRAERRALAWQALSLARAHADPEALADVLLDVARAFNGVDDLDERLALASEVEVAAASVGRRELLLEAAHERLLALIELDDLDGAERELARCWRLAHELHDGHHAWQLRGYEAMFALARGQLADAERLADDALRLGDLAGATSEARLRQLLILWRVRIAQHRLAELAPRIIAMIAQAPHVMLWRLVLCQATLAAGDVSAARARFAEVVDEALGSDADDEWWLGSLVAVAELAISLADDSTMQRVLDLLAPHERRNALVGRGGVLLGPVALTLGLLAHGLDRAAEAASHLERAAIRAGRAAHALFVTAASSALGSPRVARGTAPPASGAASIEAAGSAWILRWADAVVTVPDSKGMRYLAELVRTPDRTLHVSALEALVSDEPDRVDAQALAGVPAALRVRLAELAEVIDEAEGFGDRAPAFAARAELERITDELQDASRAPTSATAERLRQRVTKRLRDAIKRVAQHDRRLGRHLDQAVRTGMSCVYAPIAGPGEP